VAARHVYRGVLRSGLTAQGRQLHSTINAGYLLTGYEFNAGTAEAGRSGEHLRLAKHVGGGVGG